MTQIKEHDPEDLAKGYLRLGREFKSKPIDITNKANNIKLIPCWKQIGNRPNTNDENILWLWDKRGITQYELLINPKFRNYWYICLNGKDLGMLILESNGTYTVSINVFQAFYASKKDCTKDAAITYCLKIHSQGHEYK